MIEFLNMETFKQKVFDFEKNKTWVFAGDKPAIIDFYADWCAPCRMVAPILEQLDKEYAGQINIYKINTDVEQELAGLFQIMSIPSLLFIPKEGQPTMSQGALPKEMFVKAIADLFKINKPQ